MKIKFYGTAAAEGIPALFCSCDTCNEVRRIKGKDIRTRQQISIDDFIVVDFPPDVYMHTLMGLDMTKIKHILFTHSHMDHLDADEITLRGFGFSYPDENDPLYIYGNKEVLTAIKRSIDLVDINTYKYIKLCEIKAFEEFKIADYSILPLEAQHKPDENCLLFYIEKDGKGYLHGNDTGLFPLKNYEALKGKKIDIAVLDCCFGKMFSDVSHMGIESCRKVKNLLQQSCDCKNAKFVLTHFSHNVRPIQKELEELAKDEFVVAYDGIEFEI